MNDRILGAGILLGSILGIGVYFYLVFLSPPQWSTLVIQISAFTAVGAILVIVAWIGYTLATTPPPTPLEDLDIKDETEEETKTDEIEPTKKE